MKRWFCRNCRRQFFTDPLPPLLPHPRPTLGHSPAESEALGLLRMMKASGLVPGHILRLIDFPEPMQEELRRAGVNPALIKRAVEQRRKVAEAFEKLLALQE